MKVFVNERRDYKGFLFMIRYIKDKIILNKYRKSRKLDRPVGLLISSFA